MNLENRTPLGSCTLSFWSFIFLEFPVVIGNHYFINYDQVSISKIVAHVIYKFRTVQSGLDKLLKQFFSELVWSSVHKKFTSSSVEWGVGGRFNLSTSFQPQPPSPRFVCSINAPDYGTNSAGCDCAWLNGTVIFVRHFVMCVGLILRCFICLISCLWTNKDWQRLILYKIELFYAGDCWRPTI